MTRGRRMTDAEFEDRLRGLLSVRAQGAPMPPGVAEVPSRWLRPRARVGGASLARVAGIFAAALVMIAVVAQLPRIADIARFPVGSGLTAQSVAAHLEIPVGQVIMTEDGAVALRLVQGAELKAQLLLVAPTSDGPAAQVLTEVAVPSGVLDPGTSLVWTEQLSCAPARGLKQPNYLFGASPSPGTITVSVPARATQHDRLFIIVLEPADLDDQLVQLASDGRPFDERTGTLFERRDACVGEPPRPHGWRNAPA